MLLKIKFFAWINNWYFHSIDITFNINMFRYIYMNYTIYYSYIIKELLAFHFRLYYFDTHVRMYSWFSPLSPSLCPFHLIPFSLTAALCSGVFCSSEIWVTILVNGQSSYPNGLHPFYLHMLAWTEGQTIVGGHLLI